MNVRWLALCLLSLPAFAQPAADPEVPSAVSGAPPPAVRADRAEPVPEEGETPAPAPPGTSAKQAENQRAVTSCLTSRGLSAETCRERRPHQDVPMSRAESRRLEQRYQTRPLDPSAPGGFPTGASRGAGSRR